MPGETAAPGTPSGKTGTPRAQVSGIPFDITVRACDNTWTLTNSVSNTIQMTSSDASATLPQPSQLQSGSRVFTVTFNAAGTFNLLAHDQTDNTIPDGTSASTVTQVLASFTFESISQKHKTAGVPDGTTLTARDPNGNAVTGYQGPAGLKEITSFGDGRVSPTQVTLTNGVWSGNLTMYRADETSINRGNANKYAYDLANPTKPKLLGAWNTKSALHGFSTTMDSKRLIIAHVNEDWIYTTYAGKGGYGGKGNAGAPNGRSR